MTVLAWKMVLFGGWWVIGRQAELKGNEMQKLESLSRMTSRVREWVLERLQWEDWGQMLKDGTLFAKEEIRRRRWRGGASRVLPEGHDADSVASEVVAAMAQGKCMLALGWTRERLEREMKRLIRNEIRRLHALQEASRVRSEWDVLAAHEDGSPRSIFPWMAGSIPDPAEEAAQHEEQARRLRIEIEIEAYLGEDKEAIGVFTCLCKGVVKRRVIAERLGISVAAVTAARKRLERKVNDYRQGCARIGFGGNGKEPSGNQGAKVVTKVVRNGAGGLESGHGMEMAA